ITNRHIPTSRSTDHLYDRAQVIDVTVPVVFTGGKMTMLDVAEGSATEHIRARLPPAVRLAAAFKTVPAHLLGATADSLDCAEFVWGAPSGARTAAPALGNLLPGLGPPGRARTSSPRDG